MIHHSFLPSQCRHITFFFFNFCKSDTISPSSRVCLKPVKLPTLHTLCKAVQILSMSNLQHPPLTYSVKCLKSCDLTIMSYRANFRPLHIHSFLRKPRALTANMPQSCRLVSYNRRRPANMEVQHEAGTINFKFPLISCDFGQLLIVEMYVKNDFLQCQLTFHKATFPAE